MNHVNINRNCGLELRRANLFVRRIFLINMRPEVFLAVKVSVLLCVVRPSRLVSRYQHFGRTYCLHPQGSRWRQNFAPKLGFYLQIQTALQHRRPTSTRRIFSLQLVLYFLLLFLSMRCYRLGKFQF